jgi:ABC-type multidrug transport system fused ATPase/permease subunit
MLLSTVAGLFAYFKLPKYQLYGSIAFFTLIVGGMIFGPLVQKFAFSAFWTGVPFGWDLTDNKTLIAVIFWTIAYFTNRKNEKPIWIIVAAIVLLVIFSIPHSMLGSELDYSSGNIIEA